MFGLDEIRTMNASQEYEPQLAWRSPLPKQGNGAYAYVQLLDHIAAVAQLNPDMPVWGVRIEHRRGASFNILVVGSMADAIQEAEETLHNLGVRS